MCELIILVEFGLQISGNLSHLEMATFFVTALSFLAPLTSFLVELLEDLTKGSCGFGAKITGLDRFVSI